MNVENKKKIVATVNLIGDELKSTLIPTLEHPQRNAYAHVWRSIKEQFGKSYKDCDDVEVDRIIEHVLSLRSQKADDAHH